MRTARCGTASGYRRHQSDGEKPCDACARAKAEYDKRWRAAPDRTRINRLSAKAQGLAYRQLANEHPDDYQHLYQKFKRALMAEAPQEDA